MIVKTILKCALVVAAVLSAAPAVYSQSPTTRALASPQLVSPVNRATNVATPVRLSWMIRPDTSKPTYIVQLDTTNTFTSTGLVLNTTTSDTFYSVTSLAGAKVYYWRVKAVKAKDTSLWSAQRSFATAGSIPVKTTLVLPQNNQQIPSLEVQCAWKKVPAAISYRIQFSPDTTFAAPTLDETSLKDTTFETITLKGKSKYFWRVCAINTVGSGPWSDTWTFRLTDSTIVATPALVSPAHDSMHVPTKFAFKWTSSEGATSYTLQLATDSLFTTNVLSKTVNQEPTQIIDSLPYFTTFFWRVNALKGLNTSAWSTVFKFKTLVQTLSKPVQVQPQNTVTNLLSDSVTFSWTASEKATSYHLQISKTPEFMSSLVYNDSTLLTLSKTIKPFATLTKYYWRVRASNANTVSEWSEVWNFSTVKTKPIAVLLAAPAASAMNQPNDTLLFVWKPSIGAVSYTLQVAKTFNFILNSLVIDQKAIIDSTYLALGKLERETTYYWRVQAVNEGGESEWSIVNSFNTLPRLPATPKLSSPLHNSSDIPLTTTLLWQNIPAVASYSVEIALTPDFVPPLVIQAINVPTNYLNVNTLKNASKYYWRVNATTLGGKSAWSEVWEFTTAILPPSVPVLLIPLNTAKNVEVTPGLTWQPVPGAESYTVQVGKDPAFTQFVILNQEKIPTTGMILAPGLLTNGTIYYWRVCAVNNKGKGAWSETWSFTTIIITPIIQPTIKKAEVKFFATPTVAQRSDNTIRFSCNDVTVAAHAVLTIVDPLGNTLFSKPCLLNKGNNVNFIQWNCRSVRGFSSAKAYLILTDVHGTKSYATMTIGIQN